MSLHRTPEETLFQWLRTGAHALDAMLDAILAARRSIRLETYIFVDDIVGERFRHALLTARQRGVRVQVMIDALGSVLLPGAFWAPLIEAGGEMRWFNPFPQAEKFGCRNHRKLLVVDDEAAFIGGFNLSEDYHGDGVHLGWRDLGMALHDRTLVQALSLSFDELFERAAERPPAFPTFHRRPDTEVHGGNWSLLFSGPGRGHHSLRRALLRDLSKARDVRIICAYFVPPLRLRRALKKVVRRGGRVQLILAGRSDVRLSQLASQSLYSRLLRAGVEIYEYEPQILHAKLFAIDDAVYVGSANLDARSLKLNYELLLRVNDPEVAREGRQIFEEDLLHSRPIDAAAWRASRGWWRRWTERLAYEMLVRVDPFITRLTWRTKAARAVERLEPHDTKKAGSPFTPR